MLLVLDSSVAIRANLVPGGARLLDAHELIAPPLLWSEVHAGFSQLLWRREISKSQLNDILSRFEAMPVRPRTPKQLYRTALVLAGELGWAKSYDAEFLALAQIEGAKVLTADGRFRRGADRTGLVIGPAEL